MPFQSRSNQQKNPLKKPCWIFKKTARLMLSGPVSWVLPGIRMNTTRSWRSRYTSPGIWRLTFENHYTNCFNLKQKKLFCFNKDLYCTTRYWGIMKLIFIGSGTGENPWLEETGKLCHRPDFSVEIFQATSEDLDLQEGLFQSLLFHCDDCSLLILNSHAGTTYFKKFDRLLKIIREKSINTFIECTIPEEMHDFRPLFKGSDEDYQYIHSSLVST